jgi:hypothetical protein
MNSKSKKQLIIIGIFIIVALFIYYYIFNNGSSSRFGFGFGAVGDSAPTIIWKNKTDDLAQPPSPSGTIKTGEQGTIEAPATWDIGEYPTKQNYLKLTGNFTSSPSTILWLFPTTGTESSSGKDTAGVVQVDTIVWPAGIKLTPSELTAFNFYMDQDSINTYFSDIYIDKEYKNPDIPPQWSGPYVTQSIGNLLYGINKNEPDSNTKGGSADAASNPNGSTTTSYSSEQILRTNNLVTVIGMYTSLYSYICGVMGVAGTKGYGLANIKVGTVTKNQPTPITKSDAMFYTAAELGANGGSNSQTTYELSGTVKHAVWSMLLARQNQLIKRLEPKIVATL